MADPCLGPPFRLPIYDIIKTLQKEELKMTQANAKSVNLKVNFGKFSYGETLLLGLILIGIFLEISYPLDRMMHIPIFASLGLLNNFLGVVTTIVCLLVYATPLGKSIFVYHRLAALMTPYSLVWLGKIILFPGSEISFTYFLFLPIFGFMVIATMIGLDQGFMDKK